MDERGQPTGGSQSRRANLVFLALVIGLVAFVAWAVHLFTTPRKQGDSIAPSGDAGRVVELIEGASANHLSNAEQRRETLGALRVIPDEARLKGLLQCLGKPDPVRGSAAYFAGALGETDARLIEPLKAALTDWAADKAAYALARSGQPEAFGALAAVAQSPDPEHPEVAGYATWGLAAWDGPEATERLLGVLALGDPYVGHAATLALAWRDDYAAVRPLIGLLDTVQPVEEPAVPGTRAAFALGYMEERAALKHLREASHGLGDWATRERLTIAFALCRLREQEDDYNFWLLAKAARNELSAAPYRPDPGPEDTYACALHLIVQLDDSRVKQILVDASQSAKGDHAAGVAYAFAALGFEPVWDEERRGYVLRELLASQAPATPPYELAAPWPFSEVREAAQPEQRNAE